MLFCFYTLPLRHEQLIHVVLVVSRDEVDQEASLAQDFLNICLIWRFYHFSSHVEEQPEDHYVNRLSNDVNDDLRGVDPTVSHCDLLLVLVFEPAHQLGQKVSKDHHGKADSVQRHYCLSR